MPKPIIVFAALAMACVPVAARVILVPDSASTIQAGVNMASNGDTVLVAPGTYTENINWSDKSITLASRYLTSGDTLYINSTIIDASHSGTVIECRTGVDTTALICGFTIRNANTSNGGGIYCNGASPRITWNVIEKNSTTNDGAGVYIGGGASPIVERNVIRYNQTGTWGGGIYIFDGSSPRVRWNAIYGNGSTKDCAAGASVGRRIVGGRLVQPGIAEGPLITNGGGILVTDYGHVTMHPVIHNNTIVGNAASGMGGGIFSNWARPDIRNNIVVWNEGYGIYSADTPLVCSYNDVWANTNDYGGAASAGTGALSASPLFVDSADHDYHLMAGSPCIDSGDPSLPKDPDSTRSDMGAFYCPHTGISGNTTVPARRPLLLRPNPFTGSTIAVTGTGLVVYDATGKVVERTSGGCFGASLAAGVYFVQAEGFGRTRVVKLAKN